MRLGYVTETLEFFQGILEVFGQVSLHELVLFLERPLPAHQGLVETRVGVLHAIPFVAFHGSIELLVGVVQLGRGVCHSGQGCAERVKVVA